MKKLWKRAAGKIKDRNSIWMATLTKKSKHRQPDLEAAIIKATSHDDSSVNYKNAQRVYTWVRTSSSHLIVFLWALTRRIERTHNWVVALKSLILLHGVLCTKAPGTRKIGRLPFDLSSFEDGYTYTRKGPRCRACNEFVQAYFAFSDLKSVILSAELKDEMATPVMEEDIDEARMLLVRVRRWQDLLDAVLQVRPNGAALLNEVVVIEAMDCMVIEVFELYSKICDGVAKALVKVYKDKVDKAEASMALDVLQKASRQSEELSDYFQLLRRIGLLHATECPQIQQIPQEDFSELERIINGAQDEFKEAGVYYEKQMKGGMVVEYQMKDVDQERDKPSWLKTVITDEWEKFDEDFSKNYERGIIIDDDDFSKNYERGIITDPFAASLNFPPAAHYNPFIDYGGTRYTTFTPCN